MYHNQSNRWPPPRNPLPEHHFHSNFIQTIVSLDQLLIAQSMLRQVLNHKVNGLLWRIANGEQRREQFGINNFIE
jgi:hypothetical protein